MNQKQISIIIFGLLSFNVWSQDVRVNDDTGTTEQSRPAMAMHAFGPAVISWQDERNGNADIYFQLYTRRGQKFPGKENQKANDDATSQDQTEPEAAVDGRGHFIIVWRDNRTGKNYTYAQAFYANGLPKGTNVRVYDGPDININDAPCVAADGEGNCIVAWSDGRVHNAKRNVYAQRFDRDFKKIGSNFLVHAQADSEQINPVIGMNPSGKTVIAWEDKRSGVYRIWARRFSPSGNPIGNEFQVSSHANSALRCQYPSLAVQNDGSFTVGWKANDGSTSGVIYACTYDSNGSSRSDLFRVDEAGKFEYMSPARLAALPGNRTLYAWDGAMSGDLWDVFTNIFNSTGPTAVQSHAVNESEGNDTDCDAAADSNANALYVWNKHILGASDGGNIFITWEGPHKPNDIYASGGFNGMVPITWEPSYGETQNVKYVVWRKESQEIGFSIIATVDPSSRLAPASMLDYLDRSVVNGHTYSYMVSIQGETVPTKSNPASPSSQGHALASKWTSTAPTMDGILGPGEWQNAAKLNIAAPTAGHAVTLYMMNNAGFLYVAVDDSNDALLDAGNQMSITFDDNNSKTWPSTGTAGEGMIVVSQGQATFTSFWGTYPDGLGGSTVSMAAGVTSAVSNTSGHVQYEAVINLATSALKSSPGQTIGIGFMVKDPGMFYRLHYDNAGEWPFGYLWEAAETLGSLTLAVNTGIQSETVEGKPAAFALLPNFPNPFNPYTTISFEVAEPCRVVLRVQDLNGKEVATLVNAHYSAGQFCTTLDASSWPAGVYICRVRMGAFEAARKMVLVK